MNTTQKNYKKEDLKEFIKIAQSLKKKNEKLYYSFKNRMLGALEAQEILKQ